MEGPSTTNLKEKFSVFGEKLKLGSGELSRKMTERMSTVSEKMKELFQVPTQADKLVEDATEENLQFADWEKNLEICDLVNLDKVSGQDTARAIKKRIMLKSTHVQYLALTLLETCVKNCEKMFSEIASEKLLDEMVKMVDDPTTLAETREKALKLIEAWGESTDELRYLPIFEETYKSLKSRGIRFPGRDEESLAPIFTPPQSVSRSVPAAAAAGSEALYGSAHSHPRDLSASVNHDMRFEVTKEVFDVAQNSVDLLNTVLTSSPQQEVLKEELTMTLVEQCRSSQFKVQRIVESTGDADPVLFEALNVNDDLQRVLTKYEEMLKGIPAEQQQQQQQAVQPVAQPVAHVQAVEEEDSHHGPEEETSLVRKRETKPITSPTSAHDDAAIADLDEMIFGNKSTEGSHHSQTPKRQNTEDMIMF